MTLIQEYTRTLIKAKCYESEEELLEDALRIMLEVKPELKTEIGVEFYKEGKISLSRAAEIAGTSLEGIKDVLKHRGVKRIVETPSDEEIDRGVDLILE